MLGKKLWNRLFLYKAVKHEVLMHQAEHGFSLVELWGVVNGKTKYDSEFWRKTCCNDYALNK